MKIKNEKTVLETVLAQTTKTAKQNSIVLASQPRKLTMRTLGRKMIAIPAVHVFRTKVVDIIFRIRSAFFWMMKFKIRFAQLLIF
jgi:hypothetical protein